MALAAALLAGCRSHTVIDTDRLRSAASLADGDALVVLHRRGAFEQETDADFVECLGEALAGGPAPLEVVPAADFTDALYPWFEPRTAPADVEGLRRLVEREGVAERIASFGVRYLVWIEGDTRTVERNGSMGCAVGPGGGGCFGFVSWADEADYEAEIWDFDGHSLSGKISTETNGTSYLPALVIPIPLLARVENTACESMAEELRGFLGGG